MVGPLNVKKATVKTKLSEFMGDEKAMAILAKFKVPCLTCPFAQSEMNELALGGICKMYNIDAEKLLGELNNLHKK
jgi:hypothetical protein